MTTRRALVALALAVGLGHLPFLATTLEDIDSVNFALGVRDFDVAQHRPHPPGYPVYIAAGKVVAAVVGALPAAGEPSHVEARSLSLLSLIAAVVAAFLLYRVFSALRRPEEPGVGDRGSLDVTALSAAALTLSCPLIWTLAVRPMSDMPGLAVALAAQACLLAAWWWQTPSADGDRRLEAETLATSGRLIVLGALLAGLAVGVRTQTLWLTAPLLAVVLIDRIGRGVAGAVMGAGMTFGIGALIWGVPLVVVSGGLDAYLAALGTQAGEDFIGGEMLYLNPAPRLVLQALLHTFVDPWESLPLAVVVLALALVGIGKLAWRDPRTFVLVAGMGLPYLLFHLVFQDTSFTRYAAPTVPVVAFLAVQGLALFTERAVPLGAAALSVWAVVIAAPLVRDYVATPAPAIRVLDAMRAEEDAAQPAVLAMHQTFVRPLEAERVDFRQLPSPPRREWLELARFWREDVTKPVWFLADPRRTDLALVDPRSRRDVTEIRWAPSSRRVFGGMRPAGVNWIRFRTPRWFAEDGWSLTPETAGMARLMGRGPHIGPIAAWIRRDDGPMRLLIGGRNLAGPSDPSARVSVALDGRSIGEWRVAPGFFLETIELAAGALKGDGALAPLTVRAEPVSGDAPIPTAIEQFDVQPLDALLWAFGEGWHEAEYSPVLGVWHWTSGGAELRVEGASEAVRVTLDLESPLRYFGVPSRVRAIAGETEVGVAEIGASQAWSFDVPLDALRAADGRIVIETSQTFVPAERGGPPDRRALGLRVFGVSVNSLGLR